MVPFCKVGYWTDEPSACLLWNRMNIKTAHIFIHTLLVCFFTIKAHCMTLVVKESTTNYTDEQCRDAAYTTIQAAINAANSGIDDVLVCSGTYHERLNFGGSAIVVKSKNGMAVTIIDGDAAGSVCVFNQNESSDSVLDGFTIQNGSTNKGGGIYCTFSSPTIKNCAISNNFGEHGGGISCYNNSSPTIVNCNILDNIATHSGSGVYCDSSSPIITNCIILRNEATRSGSGVYCISSSPSITGCTISGNKASYSGGGVYCDYSFPIITDCIILRNEAALSGGGVYCISSSPSISNCTISENEAILSGGGVYCISSSPSISNCTISENEAILSGGGIGCYSSSAPIITNSVISDNSVTYSGNINNRGSGGGVFCISSSPSIINCTISNNTAAKAGGGIFANGSVPIVTNTIVWGNTANIFNEIFSNLLANITYSDIRYMYNGIGNINANPLFVDAANRVYYLQVGSPCIDAANSSAPAPVADKDGNARYDDLGVSNTGTGDNGNYYDMGSYENQTPTPSPPVANAGGPYTGSSNERVALDGSASFDPDGDTITYDWDFGDRTLHGAGVNPTHTYTSKGIFTITLVVNDGNTNSLPATTTITIPNSLPVANAGGPYEGSGNERVVLDGSGSFDPDGDAVTYDWDFGDSTPHGTGMNPTHTYTSNGIFTIILVVNDGDENSTPTTTTVYINMAPEIEHIDNQGMDEGAILTIPVNASDAEGDSILLSASGLPGFAVFSDEGNGKGSIRCEPGFDVVSAPNESRSYIIDIEANDRNGRINSPKKTFTIIVDNTITLGGLRISSGGNEIGGKITIKTGGLPKAVSLDFSITDFAERQIVLSTSYLPAFAVFIDNNDGTGSITFEAKLNDIGVYAPISIIATNGNDPEVTTSFQFEVAPEPVPTLNELGMFLLSILLPVLFLKKRQKL